MGFYISIKLLYFPIYFCYITVNSIYQKYGNTFKLQSSHELKNAGTAPYYQLVKKQVYSTNNWQYIYKVTIIDKDINNITFNNTNNDHITIQLSDTSPILLSKIQRNTNADADASFCNNKVLQDQCNNDTDQQFRRLQTRKAQIVDKILTDQPSPLIQRIHAFQQIVDQAVYCLSCHEPDLYQVDKGYINQLINDYRLEFLSDINIIEILNAVDEATIFTYNVVENLITQGSTSFGRKNNIGGRFSLSSTQTNTTRLLKYYIEKFKDKKKHIYKQELNNLYFHTNSKLSLKIILISTLLIAILWIGIYLYRRSIKIFSKQEQDYTQP